MMTQAQGPHEYPKLTTKSQLQNEVSVYTESTDSREENLHERNSSPTSRLVCSPLRLVLGEDDSNDHVTEDHPRCAGQ